MFRSPRILLAAFIPFLSIATAQHAYAVHSCSDPNYVRTFDARLSGRICTEVTRVPIRWSGGVAYFRILATDDVEARRSNIVVSWIRDEAGRIAAAMSQMGGLQLEDPTLMISNLSEPMVMGQPALALVLAVQPYAGQCLGNIYEFDARSDELRFKFIVGHEIFHCVQRATWPGSLDTTSDRNWWVEGSAEYFANLANPGTNFGGRFVSAFESRALSTSLLDLSYEDLVFFSWLGERSQPRGVRAFLEAVSPGRSRDAYRANAETALGPSEWKNFAVAAMTDTIHLPGSTNGVGVNWSTIPRHTLGGGELHLSTGSLTILGAVLIAAPPGLHHLHAIATPQLYGASEDINSPTGWNELPETLDACRTEHQIYLAAMTAAASGQQIRVQDRVDHDCEERPGGGPGSGSLVGTWEMTRDTLEKEIQLLNPRDACTLIAGTLRLTFNPDEGRSAPGTGSYAFDRITYRCNIKPSDGGGWFERTIDGEARTNWHSLSTSYVPNLTRGPTGVGGSVLFLSFPRQVAHSIGTIRTEMHYEVAHYNTPNPEIKDEPLEAGVGLGEFGPYIGGQYSIVRDRLHIDKPPNLGTWDPGLFYSFDFVRVGSPPHGH
jgi:hypothetical protein